MIVLPLRWAGLPGASAARRSGAVRSMGEAGPPGTRARLRATIQRIVDVYRARREDGERFIETYRRIGLKPFKEHVYATSAAA
jgi:sulfite reductase beta subunit-like hemoprotein